jgi:hypothetical protein
VKSGSCARSTRATAAARENRSFIRANRQFGGHLAASCQVFGLSSSRHRP